MEFIVNIQSFRVDAVDEQQARIKAESLLKRRGCPPLIESVEQDDAFDIYMESKKEKADA